LINVASLERGCVRIGRYRFVTGLTVHPEYHTGPISADNTPLDHVGLRFWTKPNFAQTATAVFST